MEFWLDYPSVPKNASGLNRSKNEWKTWICMISLLFLTRFEIKLEEAVKISAYEFKLLIRLCFFWDTAHPGVKWQLFWSKVSLWTVQWLQVAANLRFRKTSYYYNFFLKCSWFSMGLRSWHVLGYPWTVLKFENLIPLLLKSCEKNFWPFFSAVFIFRFLIWPF